MNIGRAAVPFALGLALVARGNAAVAEPTSSEVVTAESSVVVDVFKRGLFSPFLHDHHLRFSHVRGSFVYDAQRPEAVRGEILVNAGVVADEQTKLSADDRRKVEAQVREILDARRHPNIRFVFSRMEVLERSGTSASGTVRGTLVGTLELRGRTKPIRVPIAATFKAPVMRAKGQAEFRQTDFGIDPYSTALGTIGVEDRVEVHFDIAARGTPLALR